MPNYVTNVIDIAANGQAFEDVLAFIQRDGDVRGSFDFNKVIPMPADLNLTEGSITDSSTSAFLSHLKNDFDTHTKHPLSDEDIKKYLSAASRIKSGSRFKSFDYMDEGKIASEAEKYTMSTEDFLALGKKYLDNYIQYGARTWYGWCTKNWSTKWPATEGSLLDDQDRLRFDTAWSAPENVMRKLSEHFPDVKFHHTWADEDLGQNVGQCTYQNGEVVDCYLPYPGSAQAYELAFEVLETDAEENCLRYNAETETYEYDETMSEDYIPPSLALDDKLDLAKIKASLNAQSQESTQGREDPER